MYMMVLVAWAGIRVDGRWKHVRAVWRIDPTWSRQEAVKCGENAQDCVHRWLKSVVGNRKGNFPCYADVVALDLTDPSEIEEVERRIACPVDSLERFHEAPPPASFSEAMYYGR